VQEWTSGCIIPHARTQTHKMLHSTNCGHIIMQLKTREMDDFIEICECLSAGLCVCVCMSGFGGEIGPVL